MARWTTILLCTVALGCPDRWKPADDTTAPDSNTVETGPETGVETGDTQPEERPWFGAATYAVIMVPDGTRIEESFGDKTTWGEGYSDAYEGPTADIMSILREQLWPLGAVAKPAYNTGITITLPAHVDMALAKRTPHGHHPADATLGPGLYRPELPTMWELLRAQDSTVEQGDAGFTGNTVHMQAIDYSVYPGLGRDMPGTYEFVDVNNGSDPNAQPSQDPAVVQRVISHLQDRWRLQLVNLHQIDRSGHYDPPNHVPKIMEVEDDVASVWTDTIQGDVELADNTVMAIVSDHGRHRFADTDPAWMHHGDGCSGCREVPLMLLGPGVRQGAVATGPFVLEDVGATVAWLMGIEMPYATGMVMSEMLEGEPTIRQRSGPQALHSSRDLLAYQQFRDDFASRSEIVVDGTVFSDASAIHMEQPKVLRTDAADYVCWRQVEVGTSAQFWNWQATCMVRPEGGEWSGFGQPPDDLVWPYWDPALAADDGGRLFMAWSGNETGNAQSDTGVYLARWTQARGWEGGDTWVGGAFFPVHPSLAIDDDGVAWVAWSAGTSDGQGRYTRHVDVYRVAWPASGEQSWELSFASSYSDATGNSYERIDDAALTIHEGRLLLGYLAFSEEGTNLLTTSLTDAPDSWASVRATDASGQVFAHVRPQWDDDGWLYWGKLGSDDVAEVCRAHADALTDASCVSTGAPCIESVTPTSEGLLVTTSSGDRRWAISTITF
jgi:hypothetical protein